MKKEALNNLKFNVYQFEKQEGRKKDKETIKENYYRLTGSIQFCLELNLISLENYQILNRTLQNSFDKQMLK